VTSCDRESEWVEKEVGLEFQEDPSGEGQMMQEQDVVQ